MHKRANNAEFSPFITLSVSKYLTILVFITLPALVIHPPAVYDNVKLVILCIGRSHIQYEDLQCPCPGLSFHIAAAVAYETRTRNVGRHLLPSGCEPVRNLVQLIVEKSGTVFCSNYLDLKTQTIEAFTTVTQTKTSTRIETITRPTEITDQTDMVTITFLETSQRTIEITTQSLDQTVTEFITTGSVSTITTTVYQSPSIRERDAASPAYGLPVHPVERPPYLRAFAPAAVSSACSCLEISAPYATVVASVTSTNIMLKTITKTKIETNYIPISTSTTIVYQTSFADDLITATIGSTLTEYQTVSPTSITTVYSTIPAQCWSAGPERRFFYRAIFQSNEFLSTKYDSPPDSAIHGRGECCAICFNTPDCVLWEFQSSTEGCLVWMNYIEKTQPTGVSDICPHGIDDGIELTEKVFWGNVNLRRSVYGAGPCMDTTRL